MHCSVGYLYRAAMAFPFFFPPKTVLCDPGGVTPVIRDEQKKPDRHLSRSGFSSLVGLPTATA